jgi:hypothetical protein
MELKHLHILKKKCTGDIKWGLMYKFRQNVQTDEMPEEYFI